ncbi:DeoR/GlpR family DNA-binding transcription regulator [Sinorhizobium numidicum]|uniref:DeoR/GlpR family DNA-binding transcription regulator n=1 Tax=Sinorhizobium numidicum TaxID=680248 RepID=A0ABY8D059_9HYPH|nr:DeoR/GlpR family DNA-binding transcription regulator [Sinorhizobium numidicum]WEX76396.1 DeoR/GlpR family DNA-binding transcription regulator [Sinorhizobium numidicum]WEX83057.1 DeoR/GlpR family DNA-binding transcription regulator [Sinorhizobium numidicum]
MKPEDRREAIMDVLMEAGTASIEDLALRFGVSKMTVHRDLDDLEQAGLLRKVHGGASIQSSPQFESDFRYREKIAAGEKRRIAEYAATLVEPGGSLIIDDSSTAGAIAAFLKDIRPLTVITNNLGVVTELSGAPGINVIALGGQYSKKFNGFFGIITEEALRSLRADVAFLSSSAIQGTTAFHQDQEVVQTKRQMVKAATRKYLLVDHEKFGRAALHFLTDLDAFDAVLTGSEVSDEHAAALSEAGVKLVRVNKEKISENA